MAWGRREKGNRGQGGERLKTPFLGRGAVLPTGPCSLTHRLEEEAFKKLWGKEREKARGSCEVPKVSDSEAKWEEHLPPTDREQLDTLKEAQAHLTGTSRKIVIFPHKHTNIHTLRTTIPAGYELPCSCCHGDTVSCWPPWLHFPAPWLLKEMIDKCPNVSRPISPHRMGVGVGGCVGFHFVTIGKFVWACVFINAHIHVYTYMYTESIWRPGRGETAIVTNCSWGMYSLLYHL